MMLSSATASGSAAPCTMQFKGSLLGYDIIILADSGSSHSFLNSCLATSLPNLRPLPKSMTLRVADGGSILCSAEVSSAEWSVRGYTFHSTLRILQLGSYDMIIGMDWLEAFSPMRVDWQHKWMSIPYGQRHVTLQGLLPDSDQHDLMQLCHIAAPATSSDTPVLPPAIQHLIDEFSELFQEPSDLPPRRQCDHHIPLVPGAPPVVIR